MSKIMTNLLLVQYHDTKETAIPLNRVLSITWKDNLVSIIVAHMDGTNQNLLCYARNSTRRLCALHKRFKYIPNWISRQVITLVAVLHIAPLKQTLDR